MLNTPLKTEHTLIGSLGQFSIYLAMSAALVAFVAFLLATRSKEAASERSWKKLGKLAFLVHGAAVLCIITCLFFIIKNHKFP